MVELKKYFPEGNYEDYEALSPRNMNVDTFALMKSRTYGVTEITNIANRFKIPREAAVSERKDLMYKLSSDDYDILADIKINPSAIPFWSTHLGDTNLKMGANIMKLIRIVLALPASRGDGERFFSH